MGKQGVVESNFCSFMPFRLDSNAMYLNLTLVSTVSLKMKSEREDTKDNAH